MTSLPPLWRNRHQAGLALAEVFADVGGRSADTILLALPRGGVPVAAAMASQLRIPVATWSVRKIADPAEPELAIGALASGGVVVWRDGPEGRQRAATAQRLGWVRAQQEELTRRQRVFADPAPERLRNLNLIVVDDGIATGMTTRAALVSLAQVGAASLSLAVPVVDSGVAMALAPLVDRLEALAFVDELTAVGLWYQQFEQLSDEEVLDCLQQARRSQISDHSACEK